MKQQTTILKHIFCISIILFYGVLQVQGQNYTFKTYGLEEGICHPFVYAINQDNNGYLWAATGEGLCKFNGFDFESINTDSISGAYISLIYKDSDGVMWFAHNESGIVSYLNGRKIQKFEHGLELNSPVKGITEIGNDIVFATQFDGLIVRKANGEVSHIKEGFETITISSIFAFKHKLFVGAQEGLFVFSYNEGQVKLEYQPEDLAYINIQCFAQTRDSLGIWLGTEDMGFYKLNVSATNYVLKKIEGSETLNYLNVQHIYHDADNYLWISSLIDGVYKIKVPQIGYDFSNSIHFTKENGLPTNYIKQVFSDAEGNIWLATYEAGIAQLLDEALTVYSEDILQFDKNILSVAASDSVVWLGNFGSVAEYDLNTLNKNSEINQGKGLPKDNITALLFDKNRNCLWIGTSENGIYQYNKGKLSLFFKDQYSLGNSINHLGFYNENLVASTQNGIYLLNIKEKTHINFTTRQGLPYNNILQTLDDKQGNLFFATRSNGVYKLMESGKIDVAFETFNNQFEFVSMVIDSNNILWTATSGDGVIGFKNDSIIPVNKNTGLKNNFCYSLTLDNKGNIWVGHRIGISKVKLENYQIKVFKNEDGITGDVNLNAARYSSSNVLLFGTTQGLVVYDLNKEKSNVTPPFENIVQVTINDDVVDFTKPIVLPYSAYKLRVDYIGINYSEPGEITYKYKLEGYDIDWTITELDYALYPRVEDGVYKFYLKAYNSQGVSDSAPATFSIMVKKPIWKQWWFIIFVVLLIIGVVYTIIKYRERQQKQLQEYLQKSLDERTREVVEQKEEIELKNRDITDSINYAQRIQESILPPVFKLQENFTGSFIYYQPRDIVSGDFYWFGKVRKNKFIIVCADSTGHGVPGAFMSMIGTTLIKDICLRPEADSPSEILKHLDQELSTTLNQNNDAEKQNDGMDIIVTEIDLDTYFVRYASAMRPIIFYKDGEQLYERGSRSSIGGQYNKEDKHFDNGEIQLSKGDIIYMFSDGYPDQFGGPMGKKFKMVRLKNLLRDINQKPMEEQYNYVKSTFNLWREDLDQVDDVLFMGIKI